MSCFFLWERQKDGKACLGIRQIKKIDKQREAGKLYFCAYKMNLWLKKLSS